MPYTQYNDPMWYIDTAGTGRSVQADWEEIHEDRPSFILNKPIFAAVAFTGDYDDLINVPIHTHNDVVYKDLFFYAPRVRAINYTQYVGVPNDPTNNPATLANTIFITPTDSQSYWSAPNDQDSRRELITTRGIFNALEKINGHGQSGGETIYAPIVHGRNPSNMANNMVLRSTNTTSSVVPIWDYVEDNPIIRSTIDSTPYRIPNSKSVFNSIAKLNDNRDLTTNRQASNTIYAPIFAPMPNITTPTYFYKMKSTTPEIASYISNQTVGWKWADSYIRGVNGISVTSEYTSVDTTYGRWTITVDGETMYEDIEWIKALIPPEASSTNKLADKNWVLEELVSQTGDFISYDANNSNFPTRAALMNATTFYHHGEVWTVQERDYAIVMEDEEYDNAQTRYINVSETPGEPSWQLQYIINNAPFTQAQMDAINSGITAEILAMLLARLGAFVTTIVGDGTQTIFGIEYSGESLEDIYPLSILITKKREGVEVYDIVNVEVTIDLTNQPDILTITFADPPAAGDIYKIAISKDAGIEMQRLLPDGGTTGQFLTKNSNNDYDVTWTTYSIDTSGFMTKDTYNTVTNNFNMQNYDNKIRILPSINPNGSQGIWIGDYESDNLKTYIQVRPRGILPNIDGFIKFIIDDTEVFTLLGSTQTSLAVFDDNTRVWLYKTPLEDYDVANKGYVDTTISTAISDALSNVDFDDIVYKDINNSVTNAFNLNNGIYKIRIHESNGIDIGSYDSELGSMYIHISGDTLNDSGFINIYNKGNLIGYITDGGFSEGHEIEGLFSFQDSIVWINRDPTQPYDAANKRYVDNHVHNTVGPKIAYVYGDTYGTTFVLGIDEDNITNFFCKNAKNGAPLTISNASAGVLYSVTGMYEYTITLAAPPYEGVVFWAVRDNA